MASPAEGASSPVSDMDFDSPPLPSNKEKVDAQQDQGAEAEDLERKFNEMVSKGDDQPDARLSVKPEYDLAISMKDITVTDTEGKKFPLHGSKETQLEHCHLGGGSFGEVFRVNHAIHGVVAVKLAKPGKGDHIKMYQKEIEKHVKSLTSEFIVSIKGFVQCEDVGCKCGLVVGFVMKYMEYGSLWDFRIKKWKDIPNLVPLTNRMVYQISSGMHFLHSKDIIHRDLKLENVLIDAQLNVKIADLGLATNLKTSSGDNCWGTDSHKPPEAFRTDLPSSTKVVTTKYDVYSFSMTLYQLLTGIHPYSDRGIDIIRLLKVQEKQTPSLQPIPENTTPELIEIMKASWSYEANDRPNFTDITIMVGELDTDPTYDSLAVYFRQPSSKVTKPVLPDEYVQRGMENLTMNDHALAKPSEPPIVSSVTPSKPPIAPLVTPSEPPIVLSVTPSEPRIAQSVPPSKPPIAQSVTQSEPPIASSQTPMFGASGISCQENKFQVNIPSQTRAGQSTGFTGLVNPCIEDLPGQNGITPLMSEEGHEQEPGKWSEAKNEFFSNPPADWTKQDVFSHKGQTPSRYGHVQPDLSGGNMQDSRGPVPVDSQHGRPEFAAGSTERGTTYMPIHHQESPPEAQSRPFTSEIPPVPRFERSSAERDPTIVFDSTSMSDQDFEIKLQVSLTVTMRASIASKMDRILQSLERCKNRAYWPPNNFLCMILSSHDITLHTIQLPSTVEDEEFTLFLRVSDLSSLEKLHLFSDNGKLHKLLVKCFVDNDLKEKCLPAEPNLSVKSWQEQFSRGMEHFKKERKGEDSRQSESKHSKDAKSNTSVTQMDCERATQNVTAKARAGAGEGQGRRAEDKLCESTQKVNSDTLLAVIDEIPGNAVKLIGRHLGLKDVIVENKVYENQGEKSSEIAYQVLLEWKQQRGQQATKKVLAHALWEAKCYDAARNVR